MIQKKTLIIHCGGTLGMVQTDDGYNVRKDHLFELLMNLEHNNFIHRLRDTFRSGNNEICKTQKMHTDDEGKSEYSKNVLDLFVSYNYEFSFSCNEKNLVFDLIEMKHIIDSSLASLDDWSSILKVIDFYKNNYDGFIIIHGTDTLSYAAAFLHYMTKNIKIICTGATIPMIVRREEGLNNIINSLLNIDDVDGVKICFGDFIMPGNNSNKIRTNSINAFWSNKMKSLLNGPQTEESIHIVSITEDVINQYRCNKNHTKNQAEITNSNRYVYEHFNNKIGILKVFPGITACILKSYLSAYDAIILELFGSGNGLTNNNEIMELVNKYRNDKIIISISQCLDGAIDMIYEINHKLSQCGVIGGGALKTEAAFCLCAWALGNFSFEIAKIEILKQIKEN